MNCYFNLYTALILVTASFSNKKHSAEQGHTALFAISNNLKIIVLHGNSLLCIEYQCTYCYVFNTSVLIVMYFIHMYLLLCIWYLWTLTLVKHGVFIKHRPLKMKFVRKKIVVNRRTNNEYVYCKLSRTTINEKKYKYLIKIKTTYNHILKKFTKTLL